jgi:hypothetical protein
LPVFSVDTEEDAKQLITLCCPRDAAGIFYARELAHEQTLENLQAFSDKLARGYALLVEKGVIKPVVSVKPAASVRPAASVKPAASIKPAAPAKRKRSRRSASQ